MTILTYRGFTHARTPNTTARTPRNLIYRGVAHDGMTRDTAISATAAEMCYRGVRYTLASSGHAVVDDAPLAMAVGA